MKYRMLRGLGIGALIYVALSMSFWFFAGIAVLAMVIAFVRNGRK